MLVISSDYLFDIWPGILTASAVYRQMFLYRFPGFILLSCFYIVFDCTVEMCSFIDISQIKLFIFVLFRVVYFLS